MTKSILAVALISSLSLFQGCDNPFNEETEYIDLTFRKTKDATLFYYKPTGFYSDFSRDDYITDENNKTIYIPKLAFHFVSSSSDEAFQTLQNVYIIECDSTKEYKYLNYGDTYEAFNEDGELLGSPSYSDIDEEISIYLRIDQLRERRYVVEDRTKQKDLCVLAKWREHVSSKVSGYDVYYTSNRLRFTAEEISSVVQEYDEAGFSQYDGQY